MPSQDIVIRTLRFPPEMSSELASLPGVARVQTVRDARIVFRKTPVMIVATDVKSLVGNGARGRRSPATPTTMYRETAAGRGLMVSDNLAQLQQLKLGEMLEIPAPHGVIRLPIVGIVVDYSDQQGTILMDRNVFQRYWHDDSVNVFRVYLSSVAQPPEVKRQILDRYAGVAAGVRAHQPRAERLHPQNHRSVVRA